MTCGDRVQVGPASKWRLAGMKVEKRGGDSRVGLPTRTGSSRSISSNNSILLSQLDLKPSPPRQGSAERLAVKTSQNRASNRAWINPLLRAWAGENWSVITLLPSDYGAHVSTILRRSQW